MLKNLLILIKVNYILNIKYSFFLSNNKVDTECYVLTNTKTKNNPKKQEKKRE